MKTKYGLWWTYLIVAKLSRINGFSKEKQTMMVMLLSVKLDLSRKGFDKFKEFTTIRLSETDVSRRGRSQTDVSRHIVTARDASQYLIAYL
jgi:hypothetical protein